MSLSPIPSSRSPSIRRLSISASFDSGNIIVLDDAVDENIRLAIRNDASSEFYQWFHFRVSGGMDRQLVMTIENAAGAAYAGGWPGYRAVASYDRETWFRVDTHYEDGRLVIRHIPTLNIVWYAYFAPYSMERHHDLIASVQHADRASVHTIGRTLDGQDIDLVVIGEVGEGRRPCWITARQHPGETMAQWCAEGLMERLLDPDDAVAKRVLEHCVFYLVPNMNPDGSRRGHLRTNAVGVNLNREWNKASMERSPEVFHVLNEMRRTGCDFFLDCHGDETIPYNFIAGPEGTPSFSEKAGHRLAAYKSALARANPDFQTTHGYPLDAPRAANMSIATNYVAETFGCLAMTLEMPFKDNDDLPDAEHGWSPERCRKLGASQLDALLAVIDLL